MNAPSTGALSAEDIARFGHDPAEAFAMNLKAVQERIASACQGCGRNPVDVHLLPVTKTVPAHILRLAFAAGISSFGENKLQEARDKRSVLGDLPILGRPRACPNLILATGHGMSGIAQGVMTGQLVAEIARGAKPSFDVAPFSPDRFA